VQSAKEGKFWLIQPSLPRPNYAPQLAGMKTRLTLYNDVRYNVDVALLLNRARSRPQRCEVRASIGVETGRRS